LAAPDDRSAPQRVDRPIVDHAAHGAGHQHVVRHREDRPGVHGPGPQAGGQRVRASRIDIGEHDIRAGLTGERGQGLAGMPDALDGDRASAQVGGPAQPLRRRPQRGEDAQRGLRRRVLSDPPTSRVVRPITRRSSWVVPTSMPGT
jgi:hypothetical protein